MWKFFRYILYIGVLAAVFMAAYNIRSILYVPVLEKYLQKYSGYEIKIENFSLDFFGRGVSFSDFSADGKYKADKVTVKFGFRNIFSGFLKPSNYISAIELSNLSIDLNNSDNVDAEKSANMDFSAGGFTLPESQIKISVDNITLKYSQETLKFSGAEIYLNPLNVLFSFKAFPYDIPFYVNGEMKHALNSIFNTEITIYSERKIETLIGLSGSADFSDFNFKQIINVEKFKVKNFEISDSSGTFTKQGSEITADLSGEFGSINFESFKSGEFNVNAKTALAKINKDIGGESDLRFIYRNNDGKLDLFLKDLSFFGLELGNFEVSGIRQSNGNYDIFCDYGKNGKISCVYQNNGMYDFDLTLDGKSAGKAFGNLKTGEISIDLDNVLVSSLPVVPELSQKMKGSVTVTGALSETGGLIEFSLKDLETPEVGKTDIFGTINKNADVYAFYFYKSDKSIVFNSVVRSGEMLSTDFKFVNTDISNVLKGFGYTKDKINGMASGRIKYEKKGTTEFDIKAFDGSFYDNKFKKFEAKGDINLSRVNISHFMLKGEDDKVSAYASGLLGFTNVNPISSLNFRFRKINVAGAIVDGDITFNGSLNEKSEVTGTIESNSIKVSNVAFNNFYTNAVISTKKFVISDMRAENGLDGNINCVFGADKGKISGTVNLKNTNIKGVYSDIDEGILNMTIRLAGSLVKPQVNIAASLKKGIYAGIPFTFVSDVSYNNGALRVKEAELLSSKTKLSIKGKYAQAQKGELSVEFENLNEVIINQFVGFRAPITGDFSGSGTLFQYAKGKSRLKMNIKSSNTYVKNVKLNNLKSNIEVYGTRVSVSSASAKISDSEIRVDKGNFDIKTGRYNLNLLLVNAHIGPADVFGSIILTGKMDKKTGGSTYKGKIDIKNLWINKYRLASLNLDYGIKNKTLTLSQKSKEAGALKVSGSVDFSDPVTLRDFEIAQSSSSLMLNAIFDSDNLEFSAEGKALDGETLKEILDIPVNIDGNVDVDIKAFGELLSPDMAFSVKSRNGNIMDIPFDNFDVDIFVSDNNAEIKKARVFKKNEINVNVSGHFPLWLDSSLDEIMNKQNVNVNYEMDDSKLYLLKYLFGGQIKPRSGKIQVKGSISGTPKKISNSGELHVSGGVFDSKIYFDRIKDLAVDIFWDDNQVKINKFAGKSGSGKLNVTGGVMLDGFKIRNLDLNIFTDNKGVPMNIPELPIVNSVVSRGILQEYSKGEPRFNIKVEGTTEKPKISGWVILENTRFSFPPPADIMGSDLPDATEFDIELRTAKNTKFENSFANAWINGQISITGTFANPKSRGIIETQRGSIEYAGINFDVLNAKIEIVDDNMVYISGEGETKVYSPGEPEPETIRMVIDKSEIDNLSVRFYSKDDPSMDSQTAIAKLTRTDPNKQGQNQLVGGVSDFVLRQQALRLIDSGFATPLARNVLRKTGIADNFRVSYVNPDQQVSATDEPTFADLLYGTKYSVEKNITNQFLLGYSITFDQIERKLDLRHELEMRYKLNNNFFLSGSYELESEDSLHAPDRRLMLQHQIRFGLPSKKTKRSVKEDD